MTQTRTRGAVGGGPHTPETLLLCEVTTHAGRAVFSGRLYYPREQGADAPCPPRRGLQDLSKEERGSHPGRDRTREPHTVGPETQQQAGPWGRTLSLDGNGASATTLCQLGKTCAENWPLVSGLQSTLRHQVCYSQPLCL